MSKEDEIIEILMGIYRKLIEISEKADNLNSCKSELEDIRYTVETIKSNM
jgi:tetrahydromethanopterin S-methyltransferase subunit F